MKTGVLVLCVLAACTSGLLPAPNKALQDALYAFSVDLYKELAKGQPANLVVSPVSVCTVLAMMAQGAGGRTAEQLEAALRLDSRQAKEIYGALSKYYQKVLSETGSKLEFANRLFLNSSYEVKPEFKSTLVRDFLSSVELVAFGTGEGLRAINEWVSKSTHGKIPHILNSEPNANTALILANAVYFKRGWERPFDANYSREAAFTVTPGRTVKVPFMSDLTALRASENKDLDAKTVHMPFKGKRFSLLLILPNKEDGLVDLIKKLTVGNVAKWLTTDNKLLVHLKIPRFKLKSKNEVKRTLLQLGLDALFTQADFSGISTSAPPLTVSDIIQEAVLEIDEKGGEAAAATVEEFVTTSIIRPQLDFVADHPFAAMIVDTEKKIPLFMATVVDPSKES